MPELSIPNVAMAVTYFVLVAFPMVMMIRALNERQWANTVNEDGLIDRMSWGLAWVFVSAWTGNLVLLVLSGHYLWDAVHGDGSWALWTTVFAWSGVQLWESWRRRPSNAHFRTESGFSTCGKRGVTFVDSWEAVTCPVCLRVYEDGARNPIPGSSGPLLPFTTYTVGGLVRPPPRPLPRPGSQAAEMAEAESQADALVESFNELSEGKRRTSKDGESLTGIEAETFHGGFCPDCGHSGLLVGPEGPGAQNVKCGNEPCGSKFNVMMGFGIDRISDRSPGPPSEDAPGVEPPTRFERIMGDT